MNIIKNSLSVYLIVINLLVFCSCIKTYIPPILPAPTSMIPAIFGNNMVLQQNSDIPFWGWSLAGATVTIKTSWGVVSNTIANNSGKWQTTIKTPIAIAGQAPAYTISVTTLNKTTTYTNVLVGEVWVCAGQSNMTYQMTYINSEIKGVVNYVSEIAAANYPNIRLFTVGKDSSYTPNQTCRGAWSACSSKSVAGFSGVGYYFVRELYENKNVNVPIGLIEDAVSGSSIQCWMKDSVLKSNSALNSKYVLKTSTGLLSDPSRLYNAMLAPIIPYAIRGVIWYQGESNAGDGSLYTQANVAMLRDWRKDWGTSFSFYATQLTPRLWGYVPDIYYDRALFREAQENIITEPNTGIIPTGDVLVDTSELQQTHPSNKKSVGVRLALWALGNDYTQPIQYLGPKYESYQIVGSEAVINFNSKSIGSGLTTKDGMSIKCFKLAGSDKIFYPATATIVGNTIVVSCLKVTTPVAVRYAFTNGAITNFINNEGVAAYPFRTDSWSTVTNISGDVEIKTN